MRKWRAFALLIIGAQIPKLLSALPNEAPLQVGSGFPRFSGQTLTGKSLDLPAAAAGRPVVVVFSFSKSAGQDAHKWNENLSRDFPNVPAYTIIELQ